MLDSLILLRVDLDPSPFSPDLLPTLQVGDRISVEGLLKADLYPEEDV